jgi:hypothetical protein
MEPAVREMKIPLVEKILASGPLPESQVQVWAEVLAHELNHRSRPCLDGQVACEVFHDAKPALKVYTLRKRKEAFDWINELITTLIQAWAVHNQGQAETARRLVVETWLERNGVITITQNKKCYPFSSNCSLIIRSPHSVYVILSGSKNEPLDNQEMTDHENLYAFFSCMEKRLPVRRGRLGRSDDDRDSLGSVPRAGARREVNG